MHGISHISSIKPLKSLYMCQCGTEDCEAGHSFGPAVKDHFLIHYVHAGKGSFTIDGNTYHLEKGQGFLICPDIIAFYQADAKTPWSYSWVGFNGMDAESCLKQAGLSRSEPIFRYDEDGYAKDCMDRMIAAQQMGNGRYLRSAGLLLMFLSQLAEHTCRKDEFESASSRKELYVKMALEYIEMNYTRKISIAGMAKHIGLDRSYMCTVFKEYLKVPPQDFLVRFRVEKACALMPSGYLTISDISRSVGYEDPLLFSKMFRKIVGSAPRDYRRMIRDAAGMP